MKKTWPIEIDCPNCAAKLERALAALSGVAQVHISYVQKRITLEAADADFDAVTRAVLAKTKEIEPDTVIHTGEAAAQHQHEGWGCGHCGCGHDHHDYHEHGQGASSGRTLLLRAGASAAMVAAAHFVPFAWMKVVLCLAAYLLAGYDVLLTALRNIRRGEVFDEHFLMAVASLGAMAVGEAPEGVMVMLLYQLGEYLQDRAVDKSRRNITALMDVRPEDACVLMDGREMQVPPGEVSPGEEILVRPGEKIPLDGVILTGRGSVDTAALTGESLPRDVGPGDSVLSGCVNLTGVLRVRVTAAYGESTAARILRLVEESGENKARTERLMTRFSRIYTPAVCLAALLIALVPGFITGAWADWLYTALTFLVISCPCALVISVPLTFFSGIGGLSRRGVLVKGSNHLETLAALDAVAFDKTGTLTKGVFTVAQIVPQGMTAQALLDLAAHAEMHSAHPISASLQAALGAAPEGSRVAEAEDHPGLGLSALVDGRRVLCGNDRLMRAHGVPALQPDAAGTIVHVAAEGAYAGYIVISDQPRPGAKQALEALRQAGVKRLVMLTGDHEAAAADMAQRLGMSDYRAGLLPGDKVSALTAWMQETGRTAFVGDGVNDAPVLRRADVGVAMGGLGSDAAIEAADAVIMDDDVGKLALAVRMAKKTMAIARENIAFALGVKLLVMLLGVCGFANMWLAVFADVGVAMLCILNALRAMQCR